VAHETVERPADASASDSPLVTADMPINGTQRKVAPGVVLPILIVEVSSVPFLHLPVARIGSFMPVLQTMSKLRRPASLPL
jgi:hypothetical protein